MECVIRNKDIEVAYFESDKELNKLTYFIFLNKDKAPLYLQRGGDLEEWLKSRVAPQYRGCINDILRRLLKTLGVSLTDTFSVKCDFIHSSWENINPYTDRLLELAYIDLVDKYNMVSADDSLGGSFEKRWVSNCGIPSILKYGSGRIARNSDNEPICEYHAASLSKHLCNSTAQYLYREGNSRSITISQSFCSEGIGMVTLKDLGYNVHSYEELRNVATKNGWSTRYVDNLALIDYLTVNIDRHMENIGIFVKNATQTLIGFTPMYDFNQCLLPYYIPEEMPLEDYLNKEEYRETYWGETWSHVASWLKGRFDLNLKLAEKFEFTGGSKERCDLSHKIVQNRVNNLRGVFASGQSI